MNVYHLCKALRSTAIFGVPQTLVLHVRRVSTVTH